MASITTQLLNKNLIKPPEWLPANVMYEVITGGIAYGVSNKGSDSDIYGFCIPRKEDVFPALKGLIPGFDKIDEFEQYQHHHILDKNANKEYDLTIYSIVKYFKLCLDNNPNMLDTLYVPQNCVLYINSVGNMVRENRSIFIHKGCYNKFIGYAISQLHKMGSQKREGKRKELFEKFGFDLKYSMHLVRLAYECEMLLTEGQLDLQKHKEHLKAIRRGEVSEKDIRNWFSEKQLTLEKLYRDSTIRQNPDVNGVRQLLIDCLEHHYRTLENCFVNPNEEKRALEEIQNILNKVNKSY